MHNNWLLSFSWWKFSIFLTNLYLLKILRRLKRIPRVKKGLQTSFVWSSICGLRLLHCSITIDQAERAWHATIFKWSMSNQQWSSIYHLSIDLSISSRLSLITFVENIFKLISTLSICFNRLEISSKYGRNIKENKSEIFELRL